MCSGIEEGKNQTHSCKQNARVREHSRCLLPREDAGTKP
jgi:hypothetical protein